MLTLYDNPFSPFARKVRLVLAFKNLEYSRVDALALDRIDELKTLNPRGEVPVLINEDLCIIGSSDVVAYLEDCHPEPPLFPRSPALKARARHWQRLSDTILDAIIHDISIWTWPTLRRKDQSPPGLIEVGTKELLKFLSILNGALASREYVCDSLSIADLSLFPHLSAMKVLGFPVDSGPHPHVSSWYRRIRSMEIVKNDHEYIKKCAAEKLQGENSPYESQKIVWRGDRIEWLVSKGFYRWWFEELEQGRAVIPSAL
jgi:glutathione S-transferase